MTIVSRVVVTSPSRVANLVLLGLGLAAVPLTAGCGGGKGPSISLRVAGIPSATSNERCATAAARDGEPLSTVVSKVRVTLRSRDADGQTIDFCDRVFDFPGDPPFVRLPARDGKTIDIYTETFGPASAGQPGSAGGFERLHTGSLLGVDPAAVTLSPLRLYSTESSRCSGSTLQLARAFHTATQLPDGRVVFVGGLVASTTAAGATDFSLTAGAPATGSIEIFDPRDQSMTPISESVLPIGRAFHAAQLVTGGTACPAGQTTILLVGGLTASGPVVNVSRGTGEGRLVPYDPDGAPLAARAASNEIVCIDLASATATRKDAPGGRAAAFAATGHGPGGLLSTGGVDYDFSSTAQPAPRIVETARYPQMGGAATVQQIGSQRSGATLTQIDANTALVWGGTTSPAPIGDLITQIGGVLGATSFNVAGTGYTAFHTATLIEDDGSVLVTGGFELAAGSAGLQPPAVQSAVRLVTLAATDVSAENVPVAGIYAMSLGCSEQGRYRPAGWESSTAVHRGRVLVTGGSPSSSTQAGHCQDCEGQQSLLCPIKQASLYTRSTHAFVPAANPLLVPRLGHTSTLLGDGSVLIAGGIGSEPRAGGATASVFLGDLEVFNPRDRVPPYDPAVSGIDPDDPLATDLAAVGLRRAPGKEAATAESPDAAARRCGAL